MTCAKSFPVFDCCRGRIFTCNIECEALKLSFEARILNSEGKFGFFEPLGKFLLRFFYEFHFNEFLKFESGGIKEDFFEKIRYFRIIQ